MHGLATNNTGVWSGSEPSCGESVYMHGLATIELVCGQGANFPVVSVESS